MANRAAAVQEGARKPRPSVVVHISHEAFEAEIKEVVKAIRSGVPSPILSGDLARDAIVLCHKQTESVKRAKPQRV